MLLTQLSVTIDSRWCELRKPGGGWKVLHRAISFVILASRPVRKQIGHRRTPDNSGVASQYRPEQSNSWENGCEEFWDYLRSDEGASLRAGLSPEARQAVELLLEEDRITVVDSVAAEIETSFEEIPGFFGGPEHAENPVLFNECDECDECN